MSKEIPFFFFAALGHVHAALRLPLRLQAMALVSMSAMGSKADWTRNENAGTPRDGRLQACLGHNHETYEETSMKKVSIKPSKYLLCEK
jgi:hypothetical protein